MNNEGKTITVYGRQAVLEALRFAPRVKWLVVAQNARGPVINKIQKIAQKKGITVKQVAAGQVQKFVGPVVHQGVVAHVSFNPFLSQETFYTLLRSQTKPIVLILDQIQDPHNLGAIIRTAEIAAVSAIVLPIKGSAELNATVAKTSAGALFHMNFFQVQRLETVMQTLKEQGITLAALMPDQKHNLFSQDLNKALALVVGNEGQGVRKNIARLCDVALSIPQLGKVNSLNASVSTAVALFEIIRQQHYQA